MTNPIRVDIVSDVVCPWCAIGYHQLQRASEQTGLPVDVHWHPFELNPDMGVAGENLRDHVKRKYGASSEESARTRDRITEIGAGVGFAFDYGDDQRMWNTFRAHQLIDWAEEQGRAHEMKMALLAAFFTEGRNVDDLDVLEDVAASVGLDPSAARSMLELGERAEQVRAKERFWLEQGVSGVPAMVFFGKYLVTGAQGEDNYARILQQLASEAAA